MAALEKAVETEIAELIKDGITADELSRAKDRMQAEAIYARDSLSGGARTLGSALAVGITVDEVEAWPERIGAVTSEQILAAARATFDTRRSVTSQLLPETKP